MQISQEKYKKTKRIKKKEYLFNYTFDNKDNINTLKKS